MELIYDAVKDDLLSVKVDKRKDIYNYGADNAEPSLIEILIGGSVTAKRSVDEVAKALYGKGFEGGKIKVNTKGQTLNEVLRICARDYAKHNNFYLHVSYDADLEPLYFNPIPARDVRRWKKDDKGFSSKYVIYDNWDKKNGKINEGAFRYAYTFNLDKEVIRAQVEKDGGIQKYKGQLIHIQKDTTQVYAVSDLDVVKADARTEYLSQQFRKNGSECGFLNSKVMVTPPFPDDESKDKFKKDLKAVRGSDNAGGVILLPLANQTDDVTKQIHIVDLTGKFSDKIFEYSDKKTEDSICKAFMVPKMLVNSSDNSLFGSSGELIREAKKQLWENKEEDRNRFEEVFSMLLNEQLVIISPFPQEEQKAEKTEEQINAEAQAELRGSVGGVNALTGVQANVANGLIPISAGVATIVNLYGFTGAQAQAMLGVEDNQE